MPYGPKALRLLRFERRVESHHLYFRKLGCPKGASSLRAIAAQLTARNVRTARGGAWNAEAVRSVLLRAA
jgi:hypothetical protein